MLGSQRSSPRSCISIWLLLATRQSYFSSPRYNHHNQYRIFIPFLGFKELTAFHSHHSFFTNIEEIWGGSVSAVGWDVAVPKSCFPLTDGETEGGVG